MTQTHDTLAQARALLDAGQLQAALAAVDGLLNGATYVSGTYLLRSQVMARFTGGNALLFALHAAEAEQALNPDLPGLSDQLARLNGQVAKVGPSAPAARAWSTALDANTIAHVELCSQRHTYRSIPMVKNVFDLALYPLLLWDVRPRTIIEVGSYFGGSAVWLADLAGNFGLDTHVYSVDVVKVWAARHDRVTFIQGSGRELGTVFADAFLAALPRPLLVIEDADHSYETTTAVLNFFHGRLRPGEYVVVEDTMTSPPALTGLQQFLAAHPLEYEVDPRYCDHFGNNVTWCVNGFLRRLASPAGSTSLS